MEDFIQAALVAGLVGERPALRYEALPAPHRQPSSLPAVVLGGLRILVQFGLRPGLPSGPNRLLNVGLVGPKSAARFSSQHYLPASTRLNLPRSLLPERILWPFLGIGRLDEVTATPSMLRPLDRDHVFVPVPYEGLARNLERYLRGWSGPVFEG